MKVTRAVATLGTLLLAMSCKSAPSTGSDPVTAVAVSAQAPSLLIGATDALTARATDAAGAILQLSPTWSSSNPALATVASTGVVTGIAAGTVTVSATVSGVSGSTILTVDNPVPAITSLLPTSVTAGAAAFTLTVQGSGFVSGSTVRWNGSDRPTTLVSGSQLTAQISAADVAAAGTVAVTVFTPSPGGGTSASQSLLVNAANNPVPTLASASPTQAIAGSGAFTVTVTGTGFVAASVVQWNGQGRSTSFVSSTQLTAQITAPDIASAGTDAITVMSPAPGGGTSTALSYMVNNAIPAVQSLSAILAMAGGASFTVTVSGTGFAATSVVQWNGASRTTTFVNSTQLTATILAADIAATGSGAITVTTPAPGGGTSAPQSVRILGTAQTVSSSNDGSCAIATGGTLYCWGDNLLLQLGTGGGLGAEPTPVQLTGGPYTSVGSGTSDGCALATSGALFCWGGAGPVALAHVPTLVGGALTFSSFSLGASDLCGIATDGTTYCWGSNSSGEDGDGTTASRSTPVQVTGGQTFIRVAVGADHSCGITASGAAYCWGANGSGQLGHGDLAMSLVPEPVSGGLRFVTISAGVATCGIVVSGAAYCWGSNAAGGLGNGTTTSSSVPVAVSGGFTFASISVAFAPTNAACGVTVTGAGYCWGSNDDGVLGNGAGLATFSTVPSPVLGGFTLSNIAIGDVHTCAITTAPGGNAVCWGWRGYGYLGNGTTAYRTAPTPVVGGLTFTAIAPFGFGFCGLVAAGDIWCWGDGYYGLGNGTNVTTTVPVKVSGGHVFTTLATTGSCGIATDTRTWCWGDNTSGALGTGTFESGDNVPVAMAGAQFLMSVSAGGCGVATTNAGWCWGPAETLGNGGTNASATPVAIAGGLSLLSIAFGSDHACGVTTSHAAYCWGTNSGGELGDGTKTTQSTPVAVTGGFQFRSLSTAYQTTCGTTTTNDGVCWGSQFPTATGIFLGLAPAIPGFQFATISIRDENGCGITPAGAAVCWGLNTVGEVGNGLVQLTLPIVGTVGINAVAGGLTFQAIAVGPDAVCGLVSGAAYCWGSNADDALGIGELPYVTQPTAVSGAITFQSSRVVPVGRATGGRP